MKQHFQVWPDHLNHSKVSDRATSLTIMDPHFRDCESGQDLPASLFIPSELSQIDPSIFLVSQVGCLHCDIHL